MPPDDGLTADRHCYGPLELTVIYATERGTPDGRESIWWKLIANLPVACKADAIKKLGCYGLRWKIEMFYQVIKFGCRAEDFRLRTAARLANLIAMLCIVGWKVLWLTMVNRTDTELPATLVLTEVEILLLDRLVPPADDWHRGTVGDVFNQLVRFGGYLNRRHDGPPGYTVLWRGLTRLADM